MQKLKGRICSFFLGIKIATLEKLGADTAIKPLVHYCLKMEYMRRLDGDI